jgi:hypothetical protein
LPKQEVNLATPIGEVIAASITGVTIEACHKGGKEGIPESNRPDFGSFLKVASEEDGVQTVAVVYNVITGPSDHLHKAQALGLTREQLKAEQPQIFALLRTEIRAVTVGYFQNKQVIQHLPPKPPQMHDFVFPLSDSEVEQVSEDLGFLRLVSTVSEVPTDELLAAVIRQAYRARGNDYDFLVTAGQALSQLYRDDYERLISVLGKIKPD